MLLRYHRPGFDDLPSKERANLGADTCAHTNAFLEALRKLVTFLEHGRPNYRGPAAIQVASRDITAAVLRDVDGLTYCMLRPLLGLPTGLPPNTLQHQSRDYARGCTVHRFATIEGKGRREV